jgi:hypothetical protein
MDRWTGQIEDMDERIIAIAMDWQMDIWIDIWYFDELMNGGMGGWINDSRLAELRNWRTDAWPEEGICGRKDWREDRRIYEHHFGYTFFRPGNPVLRTK